MISSSSLFGWMKLRFNSNHSDRSIPSKIHGLAQYHFIDLNSRYTENPVLCSRNTFFTLSSLYNRGMCVCVCFLFRQCLFCHLHCQLFERTVDLNRIAEPVPTEPILQLTSVFWANTKKKQTTLPNRFGFWFSLYLDWNRRTMRQKRQHQTKANLRIVSNSSGSSSEKKMYIDCN